MREGAGTGWRSHKEGGADTRREPGRQWVRDPGTQQPMSQIAKQESRGEGPREAEGTSEVKSQGEVQ